MSPRNGLYMTIGLTLALGTTSLLAQGVGDSVVVLRDTPMREGSRTLRTVGEGTILTITKINGELFFPDLPSTAMSVGWIQLKDVLPVERAVEYYDGVLKREPGNSDAYFARARIWDHFKDYDKAIADLDEAIRLNPRNPYCWDWRAKLYAEVLMDVDKAYRDAREAVRLYNQGGFEDLYRARAYSRLGSIRLARSEWPAALSDFDRSLKLNPNWAFALYGRGLAKVELQGDINVGKADFERALALYPEIEEDRYFNLYFGPA